MEDGSRKAGKRDMEQRKGSAARRRRGLCAAVIGILLPVTVSCSRRAEMQASPPPALTRTDLDQLRTVKVFFGHQSVGSNILAGMEDLFGEQGGPLPRILETADPADFTADPLIAHAKVGENTKPLTKIEAFVRTMTSGIGARVDVAFFKFCYIDLAAHDDPNALFAHYRSAMERLQSQFPATRFVHFTMPLRVVQSGPRVWIKKIIGRPIGGYADNIARNQFNMLMRSSYGRKETLFDLALLESTGKNGVRCTFDAGGATYEALCPEHTTDGGHLNQGGRRIIAGELLRHLASLARKGA
ncbi:MAG TPA: hypothetical protein VN317_03660 [Candidatus Methanoperedens sp.]|nr:hypothetical protein [Candidatus Methanoperedens sp.]